jgi:hypothetical protein
MKTTDLKTKEVRDFFNSSLNVYNEAIIKVAENFETHMKKWKEIIFDRFDNDNIYTGELKNHIFIYHHDHYRGNSSTCCSAESLIHPHVNMDDRGYIKGIVVDLTNYLLLRILHNGFSFGHEFFYMSGDYNKNKSPKFKKSKNYETKMKELQSVKDFFDNKQSELLRYYGEIEDKFVKELFGISLKYYNINL